MNKILLFTLHKASTGVDIFFSLIFSYFCRLVAAYRGIHMFYIHPHHTHFYQTVSDMIKLFFKTCMYTPRYTSTQMTLLVHFSLSLSCNFIFQILSGTVNLFIDICYISVQIVINSNNRFFHSAYLQSLPRKATTIEIHKNITQWLHVISATLFDSQMSIDAGIARGTRKILVFPI